jgi:deoxyribodipyrimidine photo-lyase
MTFDERRVRNRNTAPIGPGPVVYWMQRDQRVQDNWALVFAASAAKERNVPLAVVFSLVDTFGQTTYRHYDFMFKGLSEVEATLRSRDISFFLLRGEPTKTIPAFVAKYDVGEVVVDQNPLRFTNAWRSMVADLLPVRLTEVDAHNIVPVWVASQKAEFAAYTFRPKITRLLREFLTEFPSLPEVVTLPRPPANDWERLLDTVKTDRSVGAVSWVVPGAAAAKKALRAFCAERLTGYDERRNDPNDDAQSNLSPYLHFGQLAPQRVALEVRAAETPRNDRDAFLEELIVRRELTDNYCFYTEDYDQVAGAHEWAQKTIAEHAKDVREYVYDRVALEAGATHDPLWNAMQIQLRQTGKLHGWCRMYWAKKILEWSTDTQTAITNALYLNDRYELDGNDPSGVVGVMWSIAGVHDRAWNERPIFGKIRYMNFAGAKRKFNVAAYIAHWSGTGDATLFS